jgi:hypothetical protein
MSSMQEKDFYTVVHRDTEGTGTTGGEKQIPRFARDDNFFGGRSGESRAASSEWPG